MSMHSSTTLPTLKGETCDSSFPNARSSGGEAALNASKGICLLHCMQATPVCILSSNSRSYTGVPDRHSVASFKLQRPHRRSAVSSAIEARQALNLINETAEAAGKVLTGRRPQSPFHTGKLNQLCMRNSAKLLRSLPSIHREGTLFGLWSCYASNNIAGSLVIDSNSIYSL